jgi:hypothetical protein
LKRPATSADDEIENAGPVLPGHLLLLLLCVRLLDQRQPLLKTDCEKTTDQRHRQKKSIQIIFKKNKKNSGSKLDRQF